MNNIPCPLNLAAQTFPERPAIVCGDRIVSYREFNQNVQDAAETLRQAGVSSGSRIALSGPNSAKYLTFIYALWRIGAAACLLNIRFPEKVLARQVEELGCQSWIKDFSVKAETLSDVVNEACLSLDQEATIMHTSGSSGEPKAVLHTFGNHYYSALGSNEFIPVTAEDRWLISLPLYHVGGLSIAVRTILGGGTLVIPPNEKDITAALQQNQVTHLSLVPTQLCRILEQQNGFDLLQGLKCILLGGGPIPNTFFEINAQVYQLPIYITYGLTEMASQVATVALKDYSKSEGHGLRVLRHRKVSVAKNNEILVKGETLFKGYVRKKEVTLPTINDIREKTDGWFATGDTGSLSTEGTEILNISGRIDNMFVSGGENIHPEIIEKSLTGWLDVEDVVVVPVADQEFGVRPVAFIKLKERSRLQKAELTAKLQDSLPRFMIPQTFYQWPEELISDTKVQRIQFQKLLEGETESLVALN